MAVSKKHSGRGRLLLLALALALGGLRLGEAAAANAAALTSLAVCLKGKALPVAGGAWFAAQQGTCGQPVMGGDAPGGEALWQAALAERPERLNVVRMLYPQSVEMAQAAVRAAPGSGPAYVWLGEALRASGQPEAALPAYLAGLKLYPFDSIAWRELGSLYEANQQLEDALYANQQACFYGNYGGNGCLNAGRLALGLGRPAEAARYYRRAVEQHAWLASTHLGLGKALLALGEAEEAMRALQAAADLGSGEAQTLLDELQP